MPKSKLEKAIKWGSYEVWKVNSYSERYEIKSYILTPDSFKNTYKDDAKIGAGGMTYLHLVYQYSQRVAFDYRYSIHHIQALLDINVDPNAVTSNGTTVGQYAMQYAYKQLLIDSANHEKIGPTFLEADKPLLDFICKREEQVDCVQALSRALHYKRVDFMESIARHLQAEGKLAVNVGHTQPLSTPNPENKLNLTALKEKVIGAVCQYILDYAYGKFAINHKRAASPRRIHDMQNLIDACLSAKTADGLVGMLTTSVSRIQTGFGHTVLGEKVEKIIDAYHKENNQQSASINYQADCVLM